VLAWIFSPCSVSVPGRIWDACPDVQRESPAQIRLEGAHRWTVLAVFRMTGIYRQNLRALPSLIGWENLGAERGDHGRYSPTNSCHSERPFGA
jgi:hypothetical protein